MSPAATEYRALVVQILGLRAAGELPEDLEDRLLTRMDCVWDRLTEQERDEERRFAEDWNRASTDASLNLVDVDVGEGEERLPRAAA